MNFSTEESKENDLIIKAATGNMKTRTTRNLLFSLTLQAVRINNPGASLLGLAKSIYYYTNGVNPSRTCSLQQNCELKVSELSVTTNPQEGDCAGLSHYFKHQNLIITPNYIEQVPIIVNMCLLYNIHVDGCRSQRLICTVYGIGLVKRDIQNNKVSLNYNKLSGKVTRAST